MRSIKLPYNGFGDEGSERGDKVTLVGRKEEREAWVIEECLVVKRKIIGVWLWEKGGSCGISEGYGGREKGLLVRGTVW